MDYVTTNSGINIVFSFIWNVLQNKPHSIAMYTYDNKLR